MGKDQGGRSYTIFTFMERKEQQQKPGLLDKKKQPALLDFPVLQLIEGFFLDARHANAPL